MEPELPLSGGCSKRHMGDVVGVGETQEKDQRKEKMCARMRRVSVRTFFV